MRGFKSIKGGVTAPRGFLAGGVYCGIKNKKKPDLSLIVSQAPAGAAGVFTTNKVNAAPVKVCRKHVGNLKAQAIIASSGCANACTGQQGMRDALRMANITAKVLGLSPTEVLVASTGSIGNFLPMDKVKNGIEQLAKKISRNGNQKAASGILTTDLVTKSGALTVKIGGKDVRIGAIAKGSGMIRPNMATMFCFFTTDAVIDKRYLKTLLKKTTDKTFNRIDVDGDTSTNDTVLCLANGMAGNKILRGGDIFSRAFEKAFEALSFEMARAIVLDGEGATKFLQVQVRGAKTEGDAHRVCLAVCNSKLVKTAMYGERSGWGRILAAIGYAGASINENKIDIYFDKMKIVKNGMTNSVPRKKLAPKLKQKELKLTIDLKVGRKVDTMWTCDLSHRYIDINI